MPSLPSHVHLNCINFKFYHLIYYQFYYYVYLDTITVVVSSHFRTCHIEEKPAIATVSSRAVS